MKSTKSLEILIAAYEDAIRRRDQEAINRYCAEVEKEADRINYPNHGRLAALHTQAERAGLEDQQ